MIFDIREFTVHDGPGIRTTVFFKGCPLRCKWCHNPEGLLPQPQLMVTGSCTGCGLCKKNCSHPECAAYDRCVRACPKGLVKISGEEMDAGELAQRLLRQSVLLMDGGITLSGGEPLRQPEFALELLHGLRPLHTVVETSGYADTGVFLAVAEACDRIYLDIKIIDPKKHRALTGVNNAPILRNLDLLAERRIPFVARVPLIPGCTDDRFNLAAIARRLEGVAALERVEFLPYNPFTPAKYPWVNAVFPLEELGGQTDAPDIPVEEFAKRGIEYRIL